MGYFHAEHGKPCLFVIPVHFSPSYSACGWRQSLGCCPRPGLAPLLISPDVTATDRIQESNGQAEEVTFISKNDKLCSVVRANIEDNDQMRETMAKKKYERRHVERVRHEKGRGSTVTK